MLFPFMDENSFTQVNRRMALFKVPGWSANGWFFVEFFVVVIYSREKDAWKIEEMKASSGYLGGNMIVTGSSGFDFMFCL